MKKLKNLLVHYINNDRKQCLVYEIGNKSNEEIYTKVLKR